MSITFRALRVVIQNEQKRYVLADGEGEPYVNVANANGLHLLDALGLAPGSSDLVSVPVFSRHLTAARAILAPDAGTETVYDLDHPRWIACGRPAGYTDLRLEELAQLVAWAIDHGYGHIAWG